MTTTPAPPTTRQATGSKAVLVAAGSKADTGWSIERLAYPGSGPSVPSETEVRRGDRRLTVAASTTLALTEQRQGSDR